jgi:anti-sigma B factor antagonist
MALLQVKTLPNMTVVTFTASSLDESNAEAVGQELYALAGRLGGQRLQLDLGEVHFLTSTGVGKLLSVYQQVRAEGGRPSLQNVRPQVYEVFAVTHLTGLLDVHQASESGPPLSEPA